MDQGEVVGMQFADCAVPHNVSRLPSVAATLGSTEHPARQSAMILAATLPLG